MKNLPRILLALCCLFLSVSPLHAGEPPFKVRVFPDQTSVKTGMMFLVNAQVLNPNEGSQELWCHSCSYEKHWVTDTPAVVIQPWTCNEDSVGSVTVDGGTTLDRNLILYIPKADKSGPVTFRLGFKRILKNGDEMEPIWSDPVTIQVTVPEGAAASPEPSVQQQVQKDQPPEVEISDSMPDDAASADSDTESDTVSQAS